MLGCLLATMLSSLPEPQTEAYMYPLSSRGLCQVAKIFPGACAMTIMMSDGWWVCSLQRDDAGTKAKSPLFSHVSSPSGKRTGKQMEARCHTGFCIQIHPVGTTMWLEIRGLLLLVSFSWDTARGWAGISFFFPIEEDCWLACCWDLVTRDPKG